MIQETNRGTGPDLNPQHTIADRIMDAIGDEIEELDREDALGVLGIVQYRLRGLVQVMQ